LVLTPSLSNPFYDCKSMPKGKESEGGDLSRRAQAFIDRHPEAIGETAPGEVKDLVEELKVHQVELEMRNEELRQIQRELEEARDKYADLYDFAPVGYVNITDEGDIYEINLTGAHMLGVDGRTVLGQAFTRFIFPDDQDIFYSHRRELIDTQSTIDNPSGA